MFGFKHLEQDRLLAWTMVLCGAMMLFGTVFFPSESASITTNLMWIAGALMLLWVFAAAAIEVGKRLFGGGGSGGEGSTRFSSEPSPESIRHPRRQRRGKKER